MLIEVWIQIFTSNPAYQTQNFGLFEFYFNKKVLQLDESVSNRVLGISDPSLTGRSLFLVF